MHAPRVEGKAALTPDGRRFASRSGPGFYTAGETTLAAWLDASPTSPNGTSPSLIRVVRAMCVNEGGLEAINSYDGCHISFGIFQWTAGLGDEPGELPILLRDLKAADAAAYADCFGRYGLDVDVDGPLSRTGLLVLDGKTLRRSQEKDVLRNVTWAYRFWRAGHHPAMRTCQFMLATRRNRALRQPDSCGSATTRLDELRIEHRARAGRARESAGSRTEDPGDRHRVSGSGRSGEPPQVGRRRTSTTSSTPICERAPERA
jgi:hypothetical protein